MFKLSRKMLEKYMDVLIEKFYEYLSLNRVPP